MLNNPFGEGKIYKLGQVGKWTFDGKIEIHKEVEKERVVNKENVKTAKSSNITINQSYDFLKAYDYTKVNAVLARNTEENFKTISKAEPRKCFVNSVELGILVPILHMNF